ncbi:hypothetical protein EWW49_28995 [Pseudomonas syringae]|nr:hypothetical protein EWW49_28995 [Pseudomonas syringae]
MRVVSGAWRVRPRVSVPDGPGGGSPTRASTGLKRRAAAKSDAAPPTRLATTRANASEAPTTANAAFRTAGRNTKYSELLQAINYKVKDQFMDVLLATNLIE